MIGFTFDKEDTRCINGHFTSCKKHHKHCVGVKYNEYVYEVIGGKKFFSTVPPLPLFECIGVKYGRKHVYEVT